MFTDIEAEVTEAAPTDEQNISGSGGDEENDIHDYRWPTRSPIPVDNGDSKPYPNRTISNHQPGNNDTTYYDPGKISYQKVITETATCLFPSQTAYLTSSSTATPATTATT